MSDGQTIPLRQVPSPRRQKQRRERLLIVLTVAVVVAAWFIGYFTSGTDVAPLVPDLMPGTTRVRTEGATLCWPTTTLAPCSATRRLGSAPGYGGPIDMLVAVDPAGNIIDTRVVTQRESPGFFRLVTRSDLLTDYGGRPLDDAAAAG